MKASQIKRNRRVLGLTQVELAHEAGLTEWTVSRVERGQRIAEDSMDALVRALKLVAKKRRKLVDRLAS